MALHFKRWPTIQDSRMDAMTTQNEKLQFAVFYSQTTMDEMSSLATIREMLETSKAGSDEYLEALMYYCEIMTRYYSTYERHAYHPVFRLAVRVGVAFCIRSWPRLSSAGDVLVKSVIKVNMRRWWRIIRVSVMFLCIHRRAVISANHPTRKRARGEFECDDEE